MKACAVNWSATMRTCVSAMPHARSSQFAYGAKVVADGGHDQALAAEQLQVVGDVAGAAAEVAPHRGHQERHVQHVHAVGQDVLAKAPLEHHDRVVGHRTADQCRHREPL
jgi:hypothetical protein